MYVNPPPLSLPTNKPKFIQNSSLFCAPAVGKPCLMVSLELGTS